MRYLLTILFSFFASIAQAAVTFDAVSTGNVGDTSASITDSITIGSDSNRLLICGITIQTDPQQTISSATLGAQSIDASMSYLDNPTANTRTWILFLKSPNTGSGTVTVNFSDTATRSALSCISLAGVDLVSTFGTPGTNLDESGPGTTSSTVSVTLPTDGMVFDVAMTRSSAPMSTTGNNVERNEVDAAGAVDQVISTNDVDGTMSWEWPFGEWVAQIAIPINAATAGEGGVTRRMVVIVE